VILIDSQRVQLLFRSNQVGLRVVLRVLGLFHLRLRNRAVCKQIFGAHQSQIRQVLVVHRLQVRIECIRDVRALHLQQQLSLLYVVVEPSANVDDAPAG
jgi:hypothetical protein